MTKSIISIAGGLLSTIPTAAVQQPNVLLVMVDDMGYSDLGCYGSEIETPHLDTLADAGVKYRQLRNYARCCPSRASLLTGRYAHEVQLGWMTAADEQVPGYRGGASRDFPMIPELLRPVGYRTHLAGKWHVMQDAGLDTFFETGQTHGDFPLDRGFDRYFGILRGGNTVSYDREGNRLGGGYFTPWDLVRDTTHIPVPNIPDDFFLTTALGDEVIARITERESSEPFFIYYAPYAPHNPVEAPEERVARCRERYRVGYDILWRERIARMEALGLFPEGITAADAKPFFPRAWEDLSEEEQTAWVEIAANFAALVETVDEQVGRAVTELEARGELDNTLIIFLSDNGATAEGGDLVRLRSNLGNAPFREFKSTSYEGGVASPLILHWPDGLESSQGFVGGRPHITDIAPTLLSAAGVPYPKRWGLNPLPPLESRSLIEDGRPAAPRQPERPLFFEHETTRAAIVGEWKLVSGGMDHRWELYHLPTDPFELRDRSADQPEIVADLEAQWTQWAETHDVLPLNPGKWNERVN